MPTVSKIIANAQRRDFSPAFLYPQRDSTTRCEAYGVPYSEHSSFTEMKAFVDWLQPAKIVPTVGNDRGQKTQRMISLLIAKS